jgi:hypothetical protein
VDGILLIIGVLHTANVAALPVIGNLSTAVRRHPAPAASGAVTTASSIQTPPLGPGVWVLRIEPAPEPAPGTVPGELSSGGENNIPNISM